MRHQKPKLIAREETEAEVVDFRPRSCRSHNGSNQCKLCKRRTNPLEGRGERLLLLLLLLSLGPVGPGAESAARPNWAPEMCTRAHSRGRPGLAGITPFIRPVGQRVARLRQGQLAITFALGSLGPSDWFSGAALVCGPLAQTVSETNGDGPHSRRRR
jgi:hypothetical protein